MWIVFQNRFNLQKIFSQNCVCGQLCQFATWCTWGDCGSLQPKTAATVKFPNFHFKFSQILQNFSEFQSNPVNAILDSPVFISYAEKLHPPNQNTAANLFNILRHSLLNCVKSEKFQSSFHQKAARQRKLPRSELWPPKMWKSDCVLASHLLAIVAGKLKCFRSFAVSIKNRNQVKNLISSRHLLLCLQTKLTRYFENLFLVLQIWQF